MITKAADRLNFRHFIGKHISIRIRKHHGITWIQALDAGKMGAVIVSGDDHIL